MEQVFGPEVLDKVYKKWANSEIEISLQVRYQTQSRRFGKSAKFEDWLWANGFTVFQKDRKRYLKYYGEEKRLTFFMLKYM